MLTEAQRRVGLMFVPPKALAATGECLVPTELSWRRAAILTARGWATLNPHHGRWLGKLTLTEAGRQALASKEEDDRG